MSWAKPGRHFKWTTTKGRFDYKFVFQFLPRHVCTIVRDYKTCSLGLYTLLGTRWNDKVHGQLWCGLWPWSCWGHNVHELSVRMMATPEGHSKIWYWLLESLWALRVQYLEWWDDIITWVGIKCVMSLPASGGRRKIKVTGIPRHHLLLGLMLSVQPGLCGLWWQVAVNLCCSFTNTPDNHNMDLSEPMMEQEDFNQYYADILMIFFLRFFSKQRSKESGEQSMENSWKGSARCGSPFTMGRKWHSSISLAHKEHSHPLCTCTHLEETYISQSALQQGKLNQSIHLIVFVWHLSAVFHSKHTRFWYERVRKAFCAANKFQTFLYWPQPWGIFVVKYYIELNGEHRQNCSKHCLWFVLKVPSFVAKT